MLPFNAPPHAKDQGDGTCGFQERKTPLAPVFTCPLEGKFLGVWSRQRADDRTLSVCKRTGEHTGMESGIHPHPKK
ncbi:MAG: hypothetical protein NVS4B11_32440 [Ktedonobacteraceae bacterium]